MSPAALAIQRSSRRRPRYLPIPDWVEPMKALLVAHVPTPEDTWAFEFKWDGVRALAFHDGRAFHLFSRNHKDATFRYPEIAELGAALGSRRAILDGEIVALDKENLPSFAELQKRMNVTRPVAVAQMAKEVPVVYMIFDVLYLDGTDLRNEAWQVRRERLESLAPILPPACRLSPVRMNRPRSRSNAGEEMLDAAREKNLEGIVGKRIDSTYEAGERSGSWIKIKLVQQQELVVGGWVHGVSLDGRPKPNDVGAILLGYYDARDKKRFHYAGAVGTGFTRQTGADLLARLKPLHTDKNPFDESAALRKFRAPIQFVRPAVVVEVEYRRWPAGGLMQQAAFKGLRHDKAAKEVVREIPAEPI